MRILLILAVWSISAMEISKEHDHIVIDVKGNMVIDHEKTSSYTSNNITQRLRSSLDLTKLDPKVKAALIGAGATVGAAAVAGGVALAIHLTKGT